MRNLLAQNITLSCTVHSPMHDLEMSNGCARNCFYPGCKGFARLSRVHVKKKTGKVLTLEKSCLVSPIVPSILKTNQINYSENDVDSLLHWSKVKFLFDVFFPNCGSHKHNTSSRVNVCIGPLPFFAYTKWRIAHSDIKLVSNGGTGLCRMFYCRGCQCSLCSPDTPRKEI